MAPGAAAVAGAHPQLRSLFLLSLSVTCFILLHLLLLQEQPMPAPAPSRHMPTGDVRDHVTQRSITTAPKLPANLPHAAIRLVPKHNRDPLLSLAPVASLHLKSLLIRPTHKKSQTILPLTFAKDQQFRSTADALVIVNGKANVGAFSDNYAPLKAATYAMSEPPVKSKLHNLPAQAETALTFLVASTKMYSVNDVIEKSTSKPQGTDFLSTNPERGIIKIKGAARLVPDSRLQPVQTYHFFKEQNAGGSDKNITLSLIQSHKKAARLYKIIDNLGKPAGTFSRGNERTSAPTPRPMISKAQANNPGVTTVSTTIRTPAKRLVDKPLNVRKKEITSNQLKIIETRNKTHERALTREPHLPHSTVRVSDNYRDRTLSESLLASTSMNSTTNRTATNDGATKRLPQCIIIGARKGGTRALLEFLGLHPAIEKATDEVHFFDDDSKYRLGLDWYRSRMPPSTADQITMEKSPAYFVTDRVPERMWAMNSSLRLLLIVRDPVVRLISDFAQLAENRRLRRESATHRLGGDSGGGISGPSVSSSAGSARAGLNKAHLQFEQVVLTVDGRVNTEYRPVGTSIYAVYFRRWLAYFPRRQIHVIDGDRLVRDPFPEVQKVEAFLGLPPMIRADAFYFNRTKGFFCVRIPNDTQDHCLNESKGRKHPSVAPAVISCLRQFYAPFNREFYSLVGHDFSWPEI